MDTPFAKNGSQAETLNAKGDGQDAPTNNIVGGGGLTPVPRASSQSNTHNEPPKMTTDGFNRGNGSSTAQKAPGSISGAVHQQENSIATTLSNQ